MSWRVIAINAFYAEMIKKTLDSTFIENAINLIDSAMHMHHDCRDG